MDTQEVAFQHEMKAEIDQASLLGYENTEGTSSEFNGKQVKSESFVSKTIKQEQTNLKSEEEEKGDQFSNNEFNGKQIQDDYFDFNSIKQEEIEIKSENEEEDEFSIKSSGVESGKEEPPVLKCFKCSYLTHKKELIRCHVRCHMPETFDCPFCPYKSNNKDNLSKHQVVHILKQEAKLHKCSKCPFTFNRKQGLTRHLLTHKKPDEITWYHCSQCPYKTRHKRDLDFNHMKSHKKDQPTYKCTLCSYESPTECNLQTHLKHSHELTQGLLSHKKPDDELTWYQCPECRYKTKFKSYLKKHIYVHRNDRPMQKCTMCSYESLRKDSLQLHFSLVHGLKDIPLISCLEEGCSFKTRVQSYLQQHIRRMHKCQKVLKCLKCPFETKHVVRFEAHKLQHENPDKWFSCPLCPFKTTYTSSLNNHSWVHKNSNEIKWLHCLECSFKTKYKRSLTRHQPKHSSGAKKDTDWFYCYVCKLRTSCKESLATHIQTKHRNDKGYICGYL